MDYNVDNIESKGEINPKATTDIVLHEDGKFQRAKIFGADGKIKSAYVTQIVNNNNYTIDPDQIVPSEALYTDDTLAGDVLKRVDKATGEDVNYREVTTWHDGTAMNDAKTDGVIYIKKGTKYYRRQFTNNIKTSWFTTIPALMFSIFNIEVDSDINLGGATVNLKTNGELLFTKGSITNGSIIGDKSAIINSSDRLIFKGVSISGTFICEKINWSWFGNYVTANATIESSDYLLLKAMFNLTFGNVGKCELTLESRTYDLYSKIGLTGDTSQGIFTFTNISDKEIKMNGAVINDLRTFAELSNQWTGVFKFITSHRISIKGGKYTNPDPFTDKVSQMGYKGASVILIQGDCSEFDVDLEINNARFGIRSGDYTRYEWNGITGLSFSKIIIKGTDIGYPISCELGDNIDLYIDVDGCHRAAYLCGVSNLNAEVKCRNEYITNVFFLLSDSRYLESGVVKYKAPYNIKANVTDTGTSIVPATTAFLAQFQTYPYFTDRSTPNVWNNIELNLKIDLASVNSKATLFSFKNENETGNAINDVYQNIKVNCDAVNTPDVSVSASTQYIRVQTSDNIIVKDFVFKGNAPYYVYLKTGLNSIFNFNNFKSNGIILGGKGGMNLNNCDFVNIKPNPDEPATGRITLNNTKGIVEVITSNLAFYSNNYQIGFAKATTLERPNAGNMGSGSILYDLNLNIPSYSNGGTWREYDTASLGVKRRGLFSEKPTSGNIFIGFIFFCTDRKTTEAPSNGILIVHIGSNVWTDMLGRVVS